MILKNFEKELSKFDLPKRAKHFAIGVSGGPDSLALTLLLKKYADKNQIKITALTVNHNLRKESQEEAKQVSKQLENLGVVSKILNWKHSEIDSNIQKQAREARLSLLTEYCNKNGIQYLFLAHTKNDVAETFMMNLFRGSGIYGLSSIPNTTLYNDITVVRPLLSFTKKEIKNYLTSNKLTWVEDPSNTNSSFLRTKIRDLLSSKEMKNIIEDEDLLTDRITLAAKNISRAREVIDSNCDEKINNYVHLDEKGFITIDRNDFLSMEEEIALKILSACLITVSGTHFYKPRFESLKELYAHIKNSNKAKTLWECETVTKKNKIFIYREIPKTLLNAEQISETKWLWDNRFEITTNKPQKIKTMLPITSFEIINKYMNQKHENLPKKVWKSLPLITTYNGEEYIPFLNTGDNKEFNINFTPLVPLSRISFFH